jgi:UDP-glucose 4-epimerase
MLIHSHSTPVSPSRVVVLGARGFVAAAVIRRLEADQIPVRALSAAELDLTDAASPAALAGLLRAEDAVVFVSALTPDRGRDIGTMMLNLRMGQHVCAALAARPVRHLVYLSTDAVYADAANPVRETSCTQPGPGFHGTMHVARERMLVETARTASIPLTLLRPSLLFGPGDTHNGYGPNRFVRTAMAERQIALFGGGEEKRDHVFIDDVAAVIAAVLQRRSTGTLNLATGSSVSFHDIAQQVRALVGDDVQVHTSARANPVTHRHFDVSALLAALPAFRFTPLRTGLATMIRQAPVGR